MLLRPYPFSLRTYYRHPDRNLPSDCSCQISHYPIWAVPLASRFLIPVPCYYKTNAHTLHMGSSERSSNSLCFIFTLFFLIW